MTNGSERQRFACPPGTGEYDEIDLALLDPADEDDRAILIRAEHPELHEALERGEIEIHSGGQVMNPVLHLSMHEIVANQLYADDPAEMWETAQRLSALGYERHEVLHMLASVVSNQVYRTLSKGDEFSADQMSVELAALPETWEFERKEGPLEEHRNRAERRAAERKRHRR